MTPGAVWLGLAAITSGCSHEEEDSGSRNIEETCTIGTWEEYAEQAVPLACEQSFTCSENPYYDSEEECLSGQKAVYANTLEYARRAGCGPFVPSAGCESIECDRHRIDTCDDTCHQVPFTSLFDPPCYPEDI